MITIWKPGALLAAALALGTSFAAEPALAACTVEGIAYRVMEGQAGDPTGPTLYIKTQPQDSFYYFLRLTDGRALHRILDRLGEVRVRVQGDSISCPVEGIIRDLGTAVGDVEVLTSAGSERVAG